MTGASWLTIEDSLIANLPQRGVRVLGTGTVKITNTTLGNNGSHAVYAQNGATVSVSGTKMPGYAGGGVFAYGTAPSMTTAVVSDSIIFGGDRGVYAYTLIAGGVMKVFVTRYTIENVIYALGSQTSGVGSALVTVSGSTVTNKNCGRYQYAPGSVIESSSTNHIWGNTTTFGNLMYVGLQ